MEAIKVLVRVRPVETHEPSVVSISGDKVISVDSSRFIQCKYNHVFPPTSTQSEVYSQLREYVTPLLNGINVTLTKHRVERHTRCLEGMAESTLTEVIFMLLAICVCVVFSAHFLEDICV